MDGECVFVWIDIDIVCFRVATHEINIYMFKGFDDDKLCLERFPKKDMNIRIHCQPCHTCLGKKKNNTRYPPLGNPGAKKKHCSWNIPWSWGATGKQSQDADGAVLGNKKKRLLGERIVNTWNAKCPIFLGNFAPKTSNYCLKHRVLGFPGT